MMSIIRVDKNKKDNSSYMHAARVVLVSVVFVCDFICLSVSAITRWTVRDIITFHEIFGRKENGYTGVRSWWAWFNVSCSSLLVQLAENWVFQHRLHISNYLAELVYYHLPSVWLTDAIAISVRKTLNCDVITAETASDEWTHAVV